MFSFKEQLRTVIEWKNANSSDLFFEWSQNLDEIKNASKLIVAPGQGAFVVYEGKIVAHHRESGLYELKTANIPFWTTLTKILQQFVSEHKLGIYFYRNAEIVDQKWGTTSLVKYEDPKYKFPVSLKAFGNYSVKIAEAERFFVNIVASRPRFTVDDLRQIVVSRLLQPLRDIFAESQKGYNEIDAYLEELSESVRSKANTIVEAIGFQLTDFRIEGTAFDEQTQDRINRIADATAEALANSALGTNYVQKEQLAALRDAASNPTGVAGIGMGIGAGLQASQMLMGTMTASAAPQANASSSVMEKLKTLKELADNGLITADEFAQKKSEILKSL